VKIIEVGALGERGEINASVSFRKKGNPSLRLSPRVVAGRERRI
jgi:hypothetical protein